MKVRKVDPNDNVVLVHITAIVIKKIDDNKNAVRSINI